jgi:hypothetical protein
MLASFRIGGSGGDVAYIINVFKGVHLALFSPGVHTALYVVEQGWEDWYKIRWEGTHLTNIVTV